MKRIAAWFLLIMCLAFASGPLVWADNFSNNFKTNLTQKSLDALAQDLGSLLGGGSIHSGETLGFPLGFDIGVHVPMVGVQSDDAILRDDGSTANAIWGQAEIGLPGRVNLIGRIGEMEDADLLGGGLKFGILNPSLPGLPALSLTALYDQMKHDYFDQQTISISAALSVKIPIITPYVVAGYDKSELEPTDEAYVGVSPSVARDLKGKSDGYRLEAGVDLTFIPLTYLNLGVGVANGQEMYHAGLGVKF